MRKRCPQCGENKVNRIHRRGILDYLSSLCCVYPYCCRACSLSFKALRLGTRFIVLGSRKSNGSFTGETRRKHRRFETRFSVVFSWEGTKGEGIVTDIGLGGCRLKTDMELIEDGCLELKLQLPGSKPEIKVENAVVRTVEKGFSGLSFSGISGDEKTRLRQYLVKLLKEAA